MQKLKKVFLSGPEIMKLIQDEKFEKVMNMKKITEENAWKSFKEVVEHFLGNRKVCAFENLVNDLLNNFHKLACNMSIKSALFAFSY